MAFNQIIINEDKILHLNVENDIDIQIGKRVNASLYLTYTGTETSLNCTYNIEDGAVVNVFIRYDKEVELEEKLEVAAGRDAAVNYACYVMNEKPLQMNAKIKLMGTGADFKFHSTVLADAKQHFDVEIMHEAPYTTGIMENYAVVKEGADYKMTACGTIAKGNHDSSSHQTTRVLTLSENQKSEVTPLLLIDENNVKASHATTLGQPDENQLYYLQTRGLNKKQALGLLTIGYFLPILDYLNDDAMKEELQREIETKVGL